MDRKKGVMKLAIVFLSAIAMMALSLAIPPPPDFNHTVPSTITCYQDSTCFYDFNATDPSTPPDAVNYSIDTPPFSEHIDANTGILNFTPTNEQVGAFENTWVIVKELDTGDGNFRTVSWYIMNVNDPPNITSHAPLNRTNATVREIYWLNFSIIAEDVDIEYGDELNYTWTIDGQINKTLLNYTNETANYTPNYLSAGIHTIKVNVTDNQSAYDWTDWTVNVTNNNRLCQQNATIPNITFAEDTNQTDILELLDYFTDPDTDDTLTFFYINNTDVDIQINDSNNFSLSYYPNPNFFGIDEVQYRCYDGYNYSNWSNVVKINVTNVQDPPTIEQLPDQVAYVDGFYSQRVIADDVDNDPLLFYNNHTDIFTIDQTTGWINFTPTITDEGNYTIEINATDGYFNTTMVYNFSIYNNSAPVLDPIGNRTVIEAQPFNLLINATDVDVIEQLTFDYVCNNCTGTVDPTIFAVTTINSSPENGTGRIQFTPDNEDIGDWQVTYYVNDTRGAYDLEVVNFSIHNVNFPPILQHIDDQSFRINKTFNLTVYATDADGDITTFADNTTLFNIVNQVLGINSEGFISIYTEIVANTSVNISVTDATGNIDWQQVWFNATYNRPPEFLPVYNMTTTEDNRTTLYINATDPDPQDKEDLTYWDNTTLFDIENYTGYVDFTPNVSQIGNYTINLTVSDGEYNSSIIWNLTVEEYNDEPYWEPPLNSYYINESSHLDLYPINGSELNTTPTNRTIWNSSIWQDNNTIIYMPAYDEESATLAFSRTFINYTNASNDTVTTGISLFTIVSENDVTARTVFTPTNDQVGIYYVNFTVDDQTGKTEDTIVKLTVHNVNDAPIITNTQPDQNVSMDENTSIIFNATAKDIDYGDTIHYKWFYKDDEISGATDRIYNFTADFFSAGNRTLKIEALDDHNLSTNYTWNLNITDVNRPGWFGQIKQTDYGDFSTGNLTQTTAQTDGTVTLRNPGSGYSLSGVYESEALNSKESNYFHNYTTINWTGIFSGPDLILGRTFEVRTEAALNGGCADTLTSNYSDPFTDPNHFIGDQDNEQCIQYRVTLTTNDSSGTPILDGVTIGYEIADYEQEQATNSYWIYLNDYFYDPDTDKTKTYNVTEPDGGEIDTSKVNITIDPINSRVNVITNANYWGEQKVVFHMTDGEYSVDSNEILITITEIPPTPQPIIIPSSGGGGGTSIQPVEVEVDRYIATPIAFRLIAPTKVTTYENDTIEIPINLFNEGNFSLEDLEISAETDNEFVDLQLSKTKIARIPAKNKDFIMLTVKSLKTYGDYEILVTAKGESVTLVGDGQEIRSPFNEKAKIFVGSLLKAEGNDTQVNTKLSFAQDLLESNPECLELNEFIQKAQKLLREGKESDASLMLDKVVESCKYLIAPKEKLPEAEKSVALEVPQQPLYVLVTVALLTLIIATSLVIGWAHVKNKANQYKRKF